MWVYFWALNFLPLVSECFFCQYHIVFKKINKIGKTLAKLTKNKKRVDEFTSLKKWMRGYHYWSHGYLKKDNKEMLLIAILPQIWSFRWNGPIP